MTTTGRRERAIDTNSRKTASLPALRRTAASLWVPFAFPTAAMLGFLAHNAREMAATDIVIPLLAAWALAELVVGVAYLVTGRRLVRTALLSSAFLAAFFNYSVFYQAASSLASRVTSSALHGWQVSAALLILLAAVWLLLRQEKRAQSAMPWVRIVAAALLVTSVVTAVKGMMGASYRSSAPKTTGASTLALPAPNASKDGSAPDIFLIVLDTYMGDGSLKQLGYDNAPFLDTLRAKGFSVVDKATSNYPQTYLSLASMLNMEYIQDVLPADALADKGTEYRRLEQLIRHPEVVRLLKERGYTYSHIASGWNATDWAPEADTFYANGRSTYVLTAAARTTWLMPFVDRADTAVKRTTFAETFDELRTEARATGDKPRFVLAHILLPHPPYVFTADGGKATWPAGDTTDPRTVEAYMAQLQYTNKLVEDLLPDLLAERGRPRTVVITGDHGYWFTPANADNGRAALLQRHTRILTAYYSSKGPLPGLREGLTPVNMFRVVLNDALGASMPLLDDRTFMATAEQPFAFEEVTKQLIAP